MISRELSVRGGMMGKAGKKSSVADNGSTTTLVSLTSSGYSSPTTSRAILQFHKAQEALKYNASLELPVRRAEAFGWCFYEFGNSAFQLLIYPFVGPFLLYYLAADEAWKEHHGPRIERCHSNSQLDCSRCVMYEGTKLVTSSGYQDLPRVAISIWRWQLTPTDVVNAAWTLGILLLFVTVFTLSQLVDYGTHQKRLMAWGVIVGSTACMLSINLWTYPYRWAEGAFLFAVAIATAGISSVVYNRYLAVMIMASSRRDAQHEQESCRYRVANRFSLSGTAAGAAGGGILTATAGVMIVKGLPNWFSMWEGVQLRFMVFSGGVWWAVAGLSACGVLLQRQGPAFPGDGRFVFSGGWTDLLSVLSSPREHRYALWCLPVVFLSSIASYGVLLTGLLIGREWLCVTDTQMLIFACIYFVVRWLSAPIACFLQVCSKANNRAMMAWSLLVMAAAPVMLIITNGPSCILDFCTAVTFHAFAASSIYSCSRTLFLDFTPAGREGTLLGLFTMATHTGAMTSSVLISCLAVDHSTLHPRRICVCLVSSLVVSLLLLLIFIDNHKGLVRAGHISSMDDPDIFAVSPISNNDILSTPHHPSPIDNFYLGQRFRHVIPAPRFEGASHASNNNGEPLPLDLLDRKKEAEGKGKEVAVLSDEEELQIERAERRLHLVAGRPLERLDR